MNGRAGSRLVAVALVAGLLAACEATTVVVQRPPIPDQPNNPDLLGQAVVVAQGDGELGPYRGWVYRTRDGLTCFEIATQGMSAIGCGPGDDGPARISRTDVEGGWFVGGGTLQPAVTAVVHTADGLEVRAPVDPGPPGLAEGASWVVMAVPGGPPESIDLLGADGAVLESFPLGP
jgi:hypothetical protein